MQDESKPTAPEKGALISRLYLLIALATLVITLKTCVPVVQTAFSRVAHTAQQTKTVQAFSALTERLRAGEAVQAALSSSFEILTGAAR